MPLVENMAEVFMWQYTAVETLMEEYQWHLLDTRYTTWAYQLRLHGGHGTLIKRYAYIWDTYIVWIYWYTSNLDRFWVRVVPNDDDVNWLVLIDGVQVGGYVAGYKGGLTFATVRGAGHMVPSYQPKRALTLISSFLLGKQLPPPS